MKWSECNKPKSISIVQISGKTYKIISDCSRELNIYRNVLYRGLRQLETKYLSPNNNVETSEKSKKNPSFWMHPEILAAIAMAVPGIFSIYYLFFKEKDMIINRLGTQLTAISCLCHFPWSAGLHVYRAYGTYPTRRIYLYKGDVAFQHIYSLCTRYAFSSQFSLVETIFHISCILHLIFCNPLKNPDKKKIIGILSAIGLGSCAFDLFNRSSNHFYVALGVAAVGFLIHHKELLGAYSPFWFHICLALPHYCLLQGLNIDGCAKGTI